MGNNIVCNSERNKRQEHNKRTISKPERSPPIPPPPDPDLEEYYKEFDKYMKDLKIQKYLSGNKEKSSDEMFKELKSFEIKELINYLVSKYNEYKNTLINGALKFDITEKDLIQNIINNENSRSVYKKKIHNEIEYIKSDDKKYKIDHLTILLIGRKGVGKTTLIRYMLGIDENEELSSVNENANFISYKSQKVPFLKLIEFRGIGLDKNNDPKIIGNEALKCIQDEIKTNNNKDYNDFIHCIWYCISGTRFEEVEFDLLQRLSQAYTAKIMPIIVVYTHAVDSFVAESMFTHIQNKDIKASFVQVIAKKSKLMNSKQTKPTSGDTVLLNETLKTCTLALQGEMINIMTKTFSDDIKTKLIKDNTTIMNSIRTNIKNNFIKYYNYILTDEQFKNYIVDMLGNSLFPYYKNFNNEITKKSLNLIKHSSIIITVDKFIKYYQPKVDELINKIIDAKAVLFIDKQATIEKERYNMRLEYKRNLNGFKHTINVFLKRNFYYISQKYIIIEFIKQICWNFFNDYSEQLNSIINELLAENNDNDIKNHLDDCFLTKLEKFSKEKGINVEINHPKWSYGSSGDAPVNDEKFDKGDIEQKSIDLVNNFNLNDSEDNSYKAPKAANVEEENWFPFRQKNWSYLNENSKNLLNDFLKNNMIYQDFYFKIKDNDTVFNSLKEYEKNDLIEFFEQKKKSFINEKINEDYKNKHIYQINTTISQIISSKEFKDIYINKINKEVDKIKGNTNFCKIKNLSIIVIGKSGVGKSSLINGMLKETLASTGLGDKQTVVDTPYKSKSMPFLRLFDTRGIELDPAYGPEKILENTFKVINNPKGDSKTIEYNDYIQCIWYCIHNSEVDQKEIEIINNLKKNEKSIPIIVVFTYAFDEGMVQNVSEQLKKNCNDIIFVPVLAKDINDVESYGLDDLLDETLKICKKTIKGNIFKKIRELSFNEIENHFRERNKENKINACNKIINIFTSRFTRVLDNDDFYKFIYYLFENIFLEFINSDELGKFKELAVVNKDLLKGITDFSNFYSNYIRHYVTKTKEIIDPILEEYAIKYLNEQVKKEKIEFKKSINSKNKCNKKDFKDRISEFLNYNFYYLSQKYIIYRVITDVNENISETIENYINNIVKELLNQKEPDYLETIYYHKFNDLEQNINQYKYKENSKIYKMPKDNMELLGLQGEKQKVLGLQGVEQGMLGLQGSKPGLPPGPSDAAPTYNPQND